MRSRNRPIIVRRSDPSMDAARDGKRGQLSAWVWCGPIAFLLCGLSLYGLSLYGLSLHWMWPINAQIASENPGLLQAADSGLDRSPVLESSIDTPSISVPESVSRVNPLESTTPVGSEAKVLPLSSETDSSVAEVIPRGLFTDITLEAGIDFEFRNGAAGEKLLPETMGGGVAFVDLLDQDGDPDLLFVGGSSWSAFAGTASEPRASLGLFRNDGTGRFEDVTRESGLNVTLYGMGPAVGDIDGDHDLDLFISAVGGSRLFRNDGGFFVEITDSSGLADDSNSWSTGATFFDADGDQDLDLFVCHYVSWSPAIERQLNFHVEGIGRAYAPPQEYSGTHSRLFLNDGQGRFEDVGKEFGIWVPKDPGAEPTGKALAVKPSDIDGDGWTDLWVANDTTANFLFRNRGAGGGFEEVGEWVGLAYDAGGKATGSMGLDSGFLRRPAQPIQQPSIQQPRHNQPILRPILLVGNFSQEMSSLYVGDSGGEFFVDESAASGLGPASRDVLTFGVLLFDVDLDGRLDLLQINGHVEDQIADLDPSQSYRQPAQLLWGEGDGKFKPADVDVLGDLAKPRAGRGAAFADLDGDGDLDLVLTQPSGRPTILRNELDREHLARRLQSDGHWIRLRLEAPEPNPWAFGAQVEILTAAGRQRQEVTPTRGYLSQSETILTFGLGTETEVLGIEARWPDGLAQSLPGLEVDQTHILLHPALANADHP